MKTEYVLTNTTTLPPVHRLSLVSECEDDRLILLALAAIPAETLPELLEQLVRDYTTVPLED